MTENIRRLTPSEEGARAAERDAATGRETINAYWFDTSGENFARWKGAYSAALAGLIAGEGV